MRVHDRSQPSSALRRPWVATLACVALAFVAQAALAQNDPKVIATLTIKGVKLTETVKFYDQSGLENHWESKPGVLYVGKTGKWEMIRAGNVATLMLRDAAGTLLFKGESHVENGDWKKGTYAGPLTDAASKGTLYADTKDHLPGVTITVE